MDPAPRHRPRRLLLACAATLAALAAAPTATRADERVPFATVLDRVEKHAVMVVLRFRKDLEEEAEGAVGVDPDSSTELFRRWRMSMRVPGFLVSDRRTVLASDLFLPPGSIASVEIEGRAGKPVPARLWAFLLHCGGLLLRADADLDGEPIAFAPSAPAVGPDTPLFVGSLAEGARGLETWAESLGAARRRAFRGKGFSYGHPERPVAGLGGSALTRTVDLVVAQDGAPVGFRFGGTLDLEESVWTGERVLAEVKDAVPLAGLKERARSLRDDSFVHAVRIQYRPADEAGPLDASPLGGFGRAPEPEPDENARHYGLAIGPDRILVPVSLPDAWVARIEKVSIEAGDEPIDATYEGRVRGLGAFVVRLTSGMVEPLPATRPAAPPIEHAFLVHRVTYRAGDRRDLVTYDRSLGSARGYGDRAYLTCEEAIPAGAFLLDLDGHPLGFAAELRPEDLERTALRGRRDDDGRRGVVAALFEELGEPGQLAADLDRRLLPQKGEDAMRLPWLGVETTPVLGAAVAEALGVAAPTRDGTRGLVVNAVHAGSPASKAGIAVDDILLSARRTSGPGSDAPPVDLRESVNPPSWPDDSEMPRPWTPRNTPLVRLLGGWGLGTTYELEVCRAETCRKVSLTVEQAPRDVTSAARERDPGTGITVKELTYEVRHALRLTLDAPGVLVSAVEEGSSAGQARILPNELIREMDGQPVKDPVAFRELLRAARAAGKQQVRVVVLRLDRSRFVDLHLVDGPAPSAPTVPSDPGAVK